MPKEDEDVNHEERTMQEMEDSGTPCSSFFQQRGAIEHKNFLRLKNQEREVIIQYKAAAVIQAAWRGFLIKENMRILNACAVKIQALIRGGLARIRWRPKIVERLELLHLQKLNKAATKIQAWIRGYLSRKNSFDFKKYKELMRKNSDLMKTVQKINELELLLAKELRLKQEGEKVPTDESSIESLRVKFGSNSSLLGSSSSSSTVHSRRSSTRRSTANAGDPETLDDFVKTSFNELSNSLSKCRIEELLTYVTTPVTDPLRRNSQSQGASDRDLDQGRGSIKKTSSSRGVKLGEKDSVDDLFPTFPEEEGVVKPDPEKVAALKNAIRLLREKIKSDNSRRLQKQHYLLRTKNCPGVYSNIYSNELTELEKELKAVKFWAKVSQKPSTAQKRSKKKKMPGGIMCHKEPWRSTFSRQIDYDNMISHINDPEPNMKNLRRELSLRKGPPYNNNANRNNDLLTSSLRTTTNATSASEKPEDTSMFTTTADTDDGYDYDYNYGNSSVSPIPNTEPEPLTSVGAGEPGEVLG